MTIAAPWKLEIDKKSNTLAPYPHVYFNTTGSSNKLTWQMVFDISRDVGRQYPSSNIHQGVVHIFLRGEGVR
jgi:hypothetical protein